LGAKRVLIVDGDADSRAVYRIMLQHSGYDVYEAETGAVAHELVSRSRVDVVVMELTLHREDGYTLIERLRGDASTKGVCIVVVTARALRDDEDRVMAYGCELFLVKPVEPKLLVNEIDRLLGTR
jgi:two-component system cell cycle response regulator DivK